ncbi:hypothetical protein [Izhakiella australiensis]|uniref:hypothetical protein n=1 Tax=Izhakiella australiensis TaxID=1926881 RepID=UPI001115982D|nr:hypothetical protein [Izhakiella australiensis]
MHALFHLRWSVSFACLADLFASRGLFSSPTVEYSVRLGGQCHRCPPLRTTGEGLSDVIALDPGLSGSFCVAMPFPHSFSPPDGPFAMRSRRGAYFRRIPAAHPGGLHSLGAEKPG